MSETVTISAFKATCLRLLDDVYKTGKPLLVTADKRIIEAEKPAHTAYTLHLKPLR